MLPTDLATRAGAGMRRLSIDAHTCVITMAVVASLASMCGNIWFALQQGRGADGVLTLTPFVALCVATAVVADLCKSVCTPLLLDAVRQRNALAITCMASMMVFGLAYSVYCTSRTVAGELANASSQDEALRVLRVKLATFTDVAAVGTIEAEIAAALAVRGVGDCRHVDGPITAAVCPAVAALRVRLAAALDRDATAAHVASLEHVVHVRPATNLAVLPSWFPVLMQVMVIELVSWLGFLAARCVAPSPHRQPMPRPTSAVVASSGAPTGDAARIRNVLIECAAGRVPLGLNYVNGGAVASQIKWAAAAGISVSAFRAVVNLATLNDFDISKGRTGTRISLRA